MEAAKKIRLNRLVHADSDSSIVIPMDHGFTMGDVPGLASIHELAWLKYSPHQALIAHKGLMERIVDAGLSFGKGLILHINGMPLLSLRVNNKRLVSSVEQAVYMGCDGISVQFNFDGDNDHENWESLGAITDNAKRSQMPVLAMIYDKKTNMEYEEAIQRQRHLIRASSELGCDFIKIAMPESQAIHDIFQGHQLASRLLIAGGNMMSSKDLLEGIKRCLRYESVKGVCIGRNVFCQKDPSQLLIRMKKEILQPYTSTEVRYAVL
ncbi:MAG: hypothetical protein HRU19_00975 [Pseudobacteriovorax sp.]|nr:hypothetical protein [Pseudobacteriovorax sp.]